MKEVFSNKTVGFCVLLGCIAMSVVTAVIYALIYAQTRFMSWTAFCLLLAGAVFGVVTVLTGFQRFAPAVLLVTVLTALLYHVYHIYFFISSVMTGIQFSGFPMDFYVNFVFYGVTLILCIACVFLPVEEQ